jgi:dTDP-4-dehydrorhamnose reductase
MPMKQRYYFYDNTTFVRRNYIRPMVHEKLRVAVTGANGQLGMELRRLAHSAQDMTFYFFSKAEWDIAIESLNEERLTELKPDVVINAGAYTNVEKAEEDTENAIAANSLGPGYLATACKKHRALPIHISTDYVFDGTKQEAYNEEDMVHPLNEYGRSKLGGERSIDAATDRYFILRTSWLYSNYGHNFFKTMVRLGKEKGSLSVVNDQKASPTYARFLAEDILKLIRLKLADHQPIPYGIYHYTQQGEASWFDFAREIMNAMKIDAKVDPVDSNRFPTKAKRPAYSKLSTRKWEEATGLPTRTWQEGVHACAEDCEDH